MKYISLLLSLLTLATFYGCIQEPEYATSPEIDFASISRRFIVDNSGSNRSLDSVGITINFRDGDGDLGLDDDDQNAQAFGEFLYDDFGNILTDSDGDTLLNKFRNNYFVSVFRKEGGTFQEVNFPGGQEFNGIFPRLNTLGNETALEGEIYYSERFFFSSLSPIKIGDTIKFEVQIADRAKNLSNVVETTPIVMGQ